MQFLRGRLIDHVHLRASDLEASRKFYKAVLQALDLDLTLDAPEHFGADELWVDRADGYTTKVHLAFQAKTREHVHRFHAAALKAGGRDNGPPGERPYHPGYYAAFVLDPDGNNIEAVFHGPFKRSADAVVVEPAR